MRIVHTTHGRNAAQCDAALSDEIKWKSKSIDQLSLYIIFLQVLNKRERGANETEVHGRRSHVKKRLMLSH